MHIINSRLFKKSNINPNLEGFPNSSELQLFISDKNARRGGSGVFPKKTFELLV